MLESVVDYLVIVFNPNRLAILFSRKLISQSNIPLSLQKKL